MRAALANALTLTAIGCGATAVGAEQLRIGASPTYPPYFWQDSAGDLKGIDAELMNEICARGGFECTWVFLEVGDLIPQLQAGAVDIVTGGIGNSPARERVVDFTCPYHLTIAAKGTLWALDTDAKPETHRVAVTTGSLHEEAMRRKGFDVLSLPGNAEAVAAVLDGRAAIYFGSAGVVEAHPEGHQLAYLNDFPISAGGAALAVSEDRPELRDALDALLAGISSDGTLSNLQSEWLGIDQGDVIADCQTPEFLS